MCLKLLLFCVLELRLMLREVSWLATFKYSLQFFVATYYGTLRCYIGINRVLTCCLFQIAVRWWEDCQMWSPSWRRRCVSDGHVSVISALAFIMHAWQPRSHLVAAADPELNMHSVRRPQTSGVMAQERERGGARWSGKVLQEITSGKHKSSLTCTCFETNQSERLALP